MKKVLIFIIAIALIAWAVFAFTRNEVVAPTGELRSTIVSGTVVSVDLDQAMYDGPFVVAIRKTDGSETLISIPSMGINLCEGKDNIESVNLIKPGMTVEASGTLVSDGSIVPCESTDHYVRIVR